MSGATALIERLLRAVNDHDLETLVTCFAEDYVNETPSHPQRGFRGREQVRRNWTQIFGSVPDLRAEVARQAVDGDVIWTEWEMRGTRPDDTPFAMCGVVIFRIENGAAAWARFFLEPVEVTSGDVNAATRRVLGEPE